MVATIIYILLFYLAFTLTEGTLRPILVAIDCIVIYPILTICLMKLSFKIGDKIYKKRKNKERKNKLWHNTLTKMPWWRR